MKKVLPIIIVLILIIGAGAGVVFKVLGQRDAPATDFMDYAAEIGLADGEYAITLNHELLEERAKEIDGKVYFNMTFVTDSLNTRCYWDENEQVFLYTMPTETLTFTPDQQAYTAKAYDGERSADDGYVVVRKVDDQYYVAADFVTANTQMDYAAFTEPNRIAIQTKWPECQMVTITKATAVRYKGGTKSEVLRNAEAGEKMYLVEIYDEWTNVVTDDGYVGWVSNKCVSDAMTVTPEAPAFTAPEYTSIQKDYKINMAWHQVMSADANSSLTSTLADTTGINTIAPTWFYFEDTEGTVASIATQDYVDQCHNADIEVWALFSNEFTEGDGSRAFSTDRTNEVLSYTSKRASVISQVVKYVQKYNIDGINIDFESISQDGADDYIQFIRELSVACRANGIVLSVDNYVPKYTAYYNRKEQGIVADYVVIMGYDETTAGAEAPGPVASLSFVAEGITDTLAVVNASKVINAIPFYSRMWSTSADGTISSFACGMEEALGYLTSHNVEPTFLDEVGLNYGTYTSDIDGNKYEVWLQDQTAVEEEMKLIQKYELAGVAEWKLGFESGKSIWKTIKSYLE